MARGEAPLSVHSGNVLLIGGLSIDSGSAVASGLLIPLFSFRFLCAQGLPRLLAGFLAQQHISARVLGTQEPMRVDEENLCSEMGSLPLVL